MTLNSWSFLDHATNHLAKPRFGDSKAPTLWPSQSSAKITNEWNEEVVVGACRRSVFFRYMSDSYKYDPAKYSIYEQLADEIKVKSIPIDKYMRWIWKAGELYEDYLIDIAKESGVFIAGQVPIYIKEFNISGKLDILTINPATHKLSIVEAKSVYGHGGNAVLGTKAARRKGGIGEPRSGNLMQIALYDWCKAKDDDTYEASRLVYGARDTGLYAEYLVKTIKNQETGITEIFYAGCSPNPTEPIKSPITIDAILAEAKYIQTSLDGGIIPERDFDLKYSEEKIDTLYRRDELAKTDKERYEKRQEWLDGQRKRETKPIIKGDWQCNYCRFKDICYESSNIKSDKYGVPKTI